jgi:hypothetical protein
VRDNEHRGGALQNAAQAALQGLGVQGRKALVEDDARDVPGLAQRLLFGGDGRAQCVELRRERAQAGLLFPSLQLLCDGIQVVGCPGIPRCHLRSSRASLRSARPRTCRGP